MGPVTRECFCSHEHITCALSDERNAQDTSQEESCCWEPDTQDTPARAPARDSVRASDDDKLP